jgi:hypothetical protein
MASSTEAILAQIDAALEWHEQGRRPSKYEDLSDRGETLTSEMITRLAATIDRLSPPGSQYRDNAKAALKSYGPINSYNIPIWAERSVRSEPTTQPVTSEESNNWFRPVCSPTSWRMSGCSGWTKSAGVSQGWRLSRPRGGSEKRRLLHGPCQPSRRTSLGRSSCEYERYLIDRDAGLLHYWRRSG